MYDVMIAGAGPAGSVAATILARAGARVVLVDRARFPRPKLCGDTINPGTMRLLKRLGLTDRVEQQGVRINGMIVTGPGGTCVEARYPPDHGGRALARREFDQGLVEAAVAAGAQFEERVSVCAPLLETKGHAAARFSVCGVRVRGRDGREREIRARVTIGADGRRSPLAFALGLATHPRVPRRWASGGYFEQVEGVSGVGEMHLRPHHYVGVAPLPGGLVNACLVWDPVFWSPAGRGEADPLRRVLESDPVLRDRFRSARLVSGPTTLGPLAVDVARPGVAGLLLAGDAAGFIDPMTGDGLRFAVGGAELAAAAALAALQSGTVAWSDSLARARQRAFSHKWRFNRALRTLVSSPTGLRLASGGATLIPSIVRRLVGIAGDVSLRAGGGG